MDETQIKQLEAGKCEVVEDLLNEFNAKNSKTLTFPCLNENNMRGRLWAACFAILEEPPSSNCVFHCLSAVRILCRDRTLLEELISRHRLLIFVKYAGLDQENLYPEQTLDINVEALKCLCNVFYNLKRIPDAIDAKEFQEKVIKRINSYDVKDIPNELLAFDVKVLFMVTALNSPCRYVLYKDSSTLQVLLDVLNSVVEGRPIGTDNECTKNITISSKNCNLACELMKTLFNAYMVRKTEAREGEELSDQINVLVETLRDIILCDVADPKLSQNLTSDAINLLTVIPPESYQSLLLPGYQVSPSKIDINNPALKALGRMVDFLDTALVYVESGKGSPTEYLSPILLALLSISKSNRVFRKYLRKVVLPNLTDVFKRPEEGDTLRNKLCRLLTSPVTAVTDLAAEWLFILCKESVGRMVKYTGYGNAAGLFARRGLLGDSITYSSDSENSDTEEYNKHKHLINPIVGCRVEPAPGPIVNMTDEEKEHLALELVNKIDQLQREGVFQPCKIGKSGRPEPIKHVIELQEGEEKEGREEDEEEEQEEEEEQGGEKEEEQGGEKEEEQGGGEEEEEHGGEEVEEQGEEVEQGGEKEVEQGGEEEVEQGGEEEVVQGGEEEVVQGGEEKVEQGGEEEVEQGEKEVEQEVENELGGGEKLEQGGVEEVECGEEKEQGEKEKEAAAREKTPNNPGNGE